jgi:hypothetical protein
MDIIVDKDEFSLCFLIFYVGEPLKCNDDFIICTHFLRIFHLHVFFKCDASVYPSHVHKNTDRNIQ